MQYQKQDAFKILDYLRIIFSIIITIIKIWNKYVVIVYLITKKNTIDDRCKILHKKYSIEDSLFLRHEAYSENIKSLRLNSIIDFEVIVSIAYVFYKKFIILSGNKSKNFSKLRELHVKSTITRHVIHFIYRICRVKYVMSIDDSRHTGEIRYVAKMMNIETYAIQHGQISDRFTGLSNYKFNNYVVWGKYFHRQLMTLGYDQSTRYIFGLPDELHAELCLHNKKNVSGIETNYKSNRLVLIIQENNVESDFYRNLVLYLKVNDYNILFRPKKNTLNDYLYLNIEESEIDFLDSFYVSVRQINPLVVLGSKSTALIESWIFDVPSIVVQSTHNENNFFPDKYSYLYAVKLTNLNLILKLVKEIKQNEINEIKSHLWGETIATKSISNILDNIIKLYV